ncbi:MAG: adenylate/guanylate cyclase domain-containing protein [Planctomycetes bacterium]|nr:adenylate/guanylate cyclase domain-containing protein [Planctomycetota bacterium]
MAKKRNGNSPYAKFEQVIEKEVLVEAAEKDLREAEDILKRSTSFATIVFFDLVGSTRYRRTHGAVRALKKSQLHNAIVSKAVLAFDGEIVKWLGDGVMAKFLAPNSADAESHQQSAIGASLRALHELANYNGRVRRRLGEGAWEEEIHTKIGISTGEVHLWTVELAGINEPVTELDPIGSTCDLAARLGSLAAEDVILVDEATFFFGWNGLLDEEDSEDTELANDRYGTKGLCLTPADQLTWNSEDGWRELLLDHERTTTYPPRWLPFGLKDGALNPFPVNSDTPFMTAKEFEDIADAQQNEYTEVMFCGEPVECNVRGFVGRVGAVPISLHPIAVPVKQAIYDSPSNLAIAGVLENADKCHRNANHQEAEKLYRQVLGIDDERILGDNSDSFDFRANVRMAQYCRHVRDLNGAQRHWNQAKKSNPYNPLIWALAGTTHLEFFIDWLGAHSELTEDAAKQHQNRAITGLTRARALGADAFDAALEQYTACYLVIARSLRRTETDLKTARDLIHELDHWVPQTPSLGMLKSLAEVYYYIASGEREYIHATRILDEITADSDQHDDSRDDENELRRDAILETEDFELLVQLARFQLGTLRRQQAHAANLPQRLS